MKKGYDASPSSKRGSNEDGMEKNAGSSSKRADSEDGLRKNTGRSSKRADSEDGLRKNAVYLLSLIPVKGWLEGKSKQISGISSLRSDICKQEQEVQWFREKELQWKREQSMQ